MRRQTREAVAKHPAELEPQQDLAAQDEHSSLFEGGFDEFGELH